MPVHKTEQLRLSLILSVNLALRKFAGGFSPCSATLTSRLTSCKGQCTRQCFSACLGWSFVHVLGV